MSRREQLFGIAEKLLKHDMPAKGGVKVSGVKMGALKMGGAKVAALPDRRVRHRR